MYAKYLPHWFGEDDKGTTGFFNATRNFHAVDGRVLIERSVQNRADPLWAVSGN